MAIKENNKGLSFVELLVAVLVSTIVVSALLYLLVQGSNSSKKQQSQSTIQNDANISMNTMSEKILQANGIAVDTSDSNKVTYELYGDSAGNFKFELDKTTKELSLYSGAGSASSITWNGASLLCANVTDMKVEIIEGNFDVITDNSSSSKGKITKVEGGMKIRVLLKVELNNEIREIERVTAMRNKVKTLNYNGNSVFVTFDSTGAVSNPGYSVEELKSFNLVVTH